jgi:hypothetical protein
LDLIQSIYDGEDNLGLYPNITDTLSELIDNIIKNIPTNVDVSGVLDTRDVNLWKYDSTYTSISDLQTIDIFNPNIESINKFPYRIHRSLPLNVNISNNWKSFQTLDFYEQIKTRGEIVNLASIGDKLIIHHSYGLFVTRDKTKLVGDTATVVLGSNDIFEIDPQEIVPNSRYVGTLNPIVAEVTKLGYVFIVAKTGKVFILNDGLNELSNTGLRQFFNENLIFRRTNVEEIITQLNPTNVEIVNNDSIITIPISNNNDDIIPNTINLTYISHTNNGDTYSITVDEEIDTNTQLTFTALRRTEVLEESDNPYVGKGYTLGFDEKYNRLLLTKNNQEDILKFPSRVVNVYKARIVNADTPEQRDYQVEDTGDGIFISEEFTMGVGADYFVIDAYAPGFADKFEIFVNDVLVATSSEDDNLSDNFGGQNYTHTQDGMFFEGYDVGFPNGYGITYFNTDSGLQDGIVTPTLPSFISALTTIDRTSQFTIETGLSIALSTIGITPFTQRIWANVNPGDKVKVRVSSGGDSFVWRILRPTILQYRCPGEGDDAWNTVIPTCEDIQYWNGSSFEDTDENFTYDVVDGDDFTIPSANDYQIVATRTEYWDGEEWQSELAESESKSLIIEPHTIRGEVNLDDYCKVVELNHGDVIIKDKEHLEFFTKGECDNRFTSFDKDDCVDDIVGYPFVVDTIKSGTFTVLVDGTKTTYSMVFGVDIVTITDNTPYAYLFTNSNQKQVKLYFTDSSSIQVLDYKSNDIVNTLDFSIFTDLITADFSNNQIDNLIIPSGASSFINKNNVVSIDVKINEISKSSIETFIMYISTIAISQPSIRTIDLRNQSGVSFNSVTDATIIALRDSILSTYNINILIDIGAGAFSNAFSNDFDV